MKNIIDRINYKISQKTKNELIPILLIPFLIALLFFAINTYPIYENINKVKNTIDNIRNNIENNLKTNENYKLTQNLKTEIKFLNQELENNNIDIRDLRKEFQWEYMVGLVNESFVGPEILEYNKKYILFTSTESFGSLYLKIKKFELERKTSSIDYIYYNAQNKTYVIKIFRKV